MWSIMVACPCQSGSVSSSRQVGRRLFMQFLAYWYVLSLTLQNFGWFCETNWCQCRKSDHLWCRRLKVFLIHTYDSIITKIDNRIPQFLERSQKMFFFVLLHTLFQSLIRDIWNWNVYFSIRNHTFGNSIFLVKIRAHIFFIATIN